MGDDQPLRWSSAHAEHVATTMSAELAQVGIHLGGARLDRVSRLVAKASLDWLTGLATEQDEDDE